MSAAILSSVSESNQACPATALRRHLARVVVTLRTPLHLGTGEPGRNVDATIVRDANGLPAIPGSSLAGVIRHWYQRQLQGSSNGASAQETIDHLFGFQEKNRGQGSRVTLSWAHLHDASDRPVDQLRHPDQLAQLAGGTDTDLVLANALDQAQRDHVRIDHTGATKATSRGKFDEEYLCTGHRFTFEIELLEDGETSHWEPLLKSLVTAAENGRFRAGGKTRRGYGNLAITRITTRTFNLATSLHELEAYADTPASLEVEPIGWKPFSLAPEASASADLTLRLRLTPTTEWMFGGGLDPTEEEEADLTPVRTTRICNESTDPSQPLRRVDDAWLISGASIKGALAHRVAFHANRLAEDFADTISAQYDHSTEGRHQAQKALEKLVGAENPAVLELFGQANEDHQDTGRSGRVFIDDALLLGEQKQPLIRHVSIDRFTGGARSGALYSERPLSRDLPIEMTVILDDPASIDPKALKALQQALLDLCEERLPLGGGSNRGLGFMQADSKSLTEVRQMCDAVRAAAKSESPAVS